jgi:hypothetical protein
VKIRRVIVESTLRAFGTSSGHQPHFKKCSGGLQPPVTVKKPRESSIFINAEAGMEDRLIHRKAPVVEEIKPSKAA